MKSFSLAIFLQGLVTALGITLVCILVSFALPAFAAKDRIIASWEPPTTAVFTTQELTTLVNQLHYPGFSPRNVSIMHRQLEKASKERNLRNDEKVIYARLLQHEHHFSRAQKLLDEVLVSAPNHSQALLLMASVSINLGQFDKAQQACKSLLGVSDNLIAGTCLLDAKMQQEPKPEYYAQLLTIQQLSSSASAQVNTWVNEVLAEMAAGQSNCQDAIGHLNDTNEQSWSISTYVTWAQCQIKTGNYEIVLQRLGKLALSTPLAPDAFLVQLAIAELHIGEGAYWQRKLSERVTIREQRQDNEHAAEVASYYLYVDRQPAKALLWAQHNWERAKSAKDRELLLSAQQANKSVSG